MNKSEKLFEAVTCIRSEIVDSAADRSFTRKRPVNIKAVAAAACFAIAAAVFVIVHSMGNANGGITARIDDGRNAVSVSTDVPSHTEPAGSMILYSPPGQLGDEIVPEKGALDITFWLNEEIAKPENSDKLFAVEIWVYHMAFVDEYLENEDAKYMRLLADPAIVFYEQEYEVWRKTIYQPTEDELIQIDKGNDVSWDRFDEYWRSTQPEDVQKAYLDARARLLEGYRAYQENTSEETMHELFDAKIHEELERERDRLLSLGYSVELNDGKLTGCLTPEQILEFPCEQNHGYKIIWMENESD